MSTSSHRFRYTRKAWTQRSSLFLATVACLISGCRQESQPAWQLDEQVRSLLSPDIREKLETTRVPVWVPRTLARMQIGSLELTDRKYELSVFSGDARIRVRGDALESDDRSARVAILGTVETHAVGHRTLIIGATPGSRRGGSSYSARWVEGTGAYSVDVSCVQPHAMCETSMFILQVIGDLAFVGGARP